MASLSDITVAISTNISNFQKGLDRAQRKLQKAGKGFKEAGTTMSQSLTLPLAAAGAAAVKVASDFEDAMVEIEKVTSSATADELRSSIKAMAAEIPLAQSELAGLAADAARFGISGPKAIEKFTRTAAKMATATELSTQEASESLAKLAEVTDTPVSKMENLGSAVNSLSNTAGTSSQEIVDNMLRASKGLSALGVNQKEMAGLAATLNEVSPSATNAGTQLNRLSSQLLDPRIVKELSNILGMTSAEFNELRKNSPVKLMQKLASSFSNGGQQARKLRAALSEQSVKAVSGLAQNIGGLSRNLDTSSTAFRQNTSLSNEAEKAYSKFSSQLQMALNRLRNVAITIGNKLMPFVLDLVGVIERGISAFSSLSSRMQDIIIVGAGIAAALGPVLFIFGFFVSSVLPGLISALSAVAGAFGVLFSPIGAIGAALAGAAALIIQNWGEVKQFFQALGVTDALQTLFNVAKKVVQGVIGAAALLFNKVSGFLEGTGDTFAKLGEVVRMKLGAMFSFLKSTFNAIIDAGFVLFEGIKSSFGFIIDIFSLDMEGALKNLKGMFKSILLAIMKLVEQVIKNILSFFQNLAQKIPGFGDSVAASIEGMKHDIDFFSNKAKFELGLTDVAKDAEQTKESVKDLGKEAVKQGKKITSSLSFPSLGGGGSGGGQDKKSLPALVRDFTNAMNQGGGGGGSTGPQLSKNEQTPGMAPQIQNVQKEIKLNQRLIQQRRRKQLQQKKMRMLSQQTGEAVGRSLGRVQKALWHTGLNIFLSLKTSTGSVSTVLKF